MRTLPALLAAVCLASPCLAADYRAEKLDEGPPADLAPEIAELLSPTGIRVIRGTKTKLCDIWLCKELAVKDGFEATPEVLYPFAPGQLIGVAQYRRRGSDFRDQDIDRGVYTLRYGLQPVDGAHVGTSLTRDFLLLLPADRDKSPGPLKYEPMTEASIEAAGTAHPALLSLQAVVESSDGMRHDENHDWWIVSLKGSSKGGAALPMQLVVMGVGEE